MAFPVGRALPAAPGVAHPCIFLSVVVSYHHTKQRKLEPTLKVRPCFVDQALRFTFRQQRH